MRNTTSHCIDEGNVPIDSQGDADRAVLQGLLHDPGVDSHRDQDGCRAVAHIMEAREQGDQPHVATA
jgi:hypothetical protein